MTGPAAGAGRFPDRAPDVGRYRFYRSANGVWLTDEVPARFLGQVPADRAGD